MASISSGYTAQLHANAIACDRARILARLQTRGPCVQGARSTGAAAPSSLLEREAASGCNGGDFFQKATTSGVHTLSVQNNVINCPNNSLNTNCGKYVRSFPVPCPVIRTKNPVIVSISQCQPSRFF
jgi:hypothetical protein